MTARLGDDLRHCLRALRGSAGLAVAVVAVSGLGLAAVIAVAAFVEAFLLRPLPYADAERLVWLQSRHGDQVLGVSHLDFLDWRDGIQPITGMARFDARNHMVLSGAGEAESVLAARTTSDLFPLLGVDAHLGRVFTAEADQPGAGGVVLLSHDLWRRRFGADRGIVGQQLRLDGAPYAIVGVMPPGFRFPAQTDVWVPSSAWSDQWAHRTIRVDAALGRLAPGTDLAGARAAAAAVATRLATEHPQSNTGIGIEITPLREVWIADSRRPLALVLGTCGLLLLIAAANATHLMLVWSNRRLPELAMRSALGALPARLLRQRVLEAALLGLAAGLLGLALAAVGLRQAVLFLPPELPSWSRVELTPALAGWGLALAVIYGVAVGLVAGARGLRSRELPLRTVDRRTVAARADGRGSHLLAIGQIALALVLLVGAALMAMSLRSLLRVDPGFDAADVLAVEIDLPVFAIDGYQQVNELYRRLVEEVSTVPGTRAVAMTTSLPLGGQETWHLWEITLEDQPEVEQRNNPRVHGQGVSDGYFEALDVPILEGRPFEPRDAGPETPGVIVGRGLAEQLWPQRPALGRKLKLGPPAAPSPLLTVVGVAGDVRYDSLSRSDQLDLYVPLQRLPSWPIHLVAEAEGSAGTLAESVRRRIVETSPDLGLRSVQPLTDHVTASLWQQRTWTALLGTSAVLAVVLALSGVFAVISHLVDSHRRELAVRIALGARRADIGFYVLGRTARLAGVGLGAGAVVSLLLSGLLRGLLFEVAPTNTAILIGAAVLLAAAILGACAAPLYRALRVDPWHQLQSL